MARVFTNSPVLKAVTGYSGPGDVVSSAVSYWGLRAYSLSTVGTNAVRLKRSSDNAESDFVTILGGGLDVSAIASFKGAANLTVVTLYDQSGNGNHLSATGDLPFTLSSSGLAANRSSIDFDGASAWSLFGSTIAALTGAITYSIALKGTHSTFVVPKNVLVGQNHSVGFVSVVSAEDVWLNRGSNVTSPYALGTWIAVQAVMNGASSDMNVNGSASSGDAGAGSETISTISIGGSGSNRFAGSFTEIGKWNSAFTTQNRIDMAANQRAFWGF